MRFLLPLLCLAFLLSACAFTSSKGNTQSIALIGPNDQVIALTVVVANTADERSQGLMGREELPEDHGMLFIFSVSEVVTFWMKDTLIPLDIIYFNAMGWVIDSDTMVPCTADPCKRYTSDEPASTALEVNAGFVKAKNINKEWRLALPVK